MRRDTYCDIAPLGTNVIMLQHPEASGEEEGVEEWDGVRGSGREGEGEGERERDTMSVKQRWSNSIQREGERK